MCLVYFDPVRSLLIQTVFFFITASRNTQASLFSSHATFKAAVEQMQGVFIGALTDSVWRFITI